MPLLEKITPEKDEFKLICLRDQRTGKCISCIFYRRRIKELDLGSLANWRVIKTQLFFIDVTSAMEAGELMRPCCQLSKADCG